MLVVFVFCFFVFLFFFFTVEKNRRHRVRVVRALDVSFGSPEFKSRPDHQLDLFSVAVDLHRSKPLIS